MNQWMKQQISNFSWRKFAVSSVGLLTLMGILSFAIYEVTKVSVTVEVEDELDTIYTHASTVGELLEERGIDVSIHDYIEPSEDTALTEAMNIVYIPAQQVMVNIDDDEKPIWTIAGTVQELMEELDIVVNEHDVIEPPLDTAVTADMTINYETAFPVTVFSDGEEEEIWTTSTTVADFLERENVSIGDLDKVEPELDDVLEQETEITVVRVEKVTDVVEESVDYATVTRNDSSLERGSEKVIQSGSEGRIKKHYEVIFEDGEEVSRELVKEEVVSDSEDRIVAVGTKDPAPTVSRGSSSSSGTVSKGEWMNFTATAYTAYCNGCSGVTYTGIDLRSNPDAKVIAVDPNVIPLGSRVEVEGRGTYLAADIGGAIQGRKIDIFIPDRNQVNRFGRQSVRIRIVE
ncbi:MULTISPECIES: G5 and 3D domain-containing protein [Bacillaceae]|uniref:DUF348 domain-containing protein n=1 Tax=Evansella alkalicola TaxID=745819 RepID=A0ABS6JU11_9BACI|nr:MULTISPECIES: G5 and 3D domain-containing protein [Bacillaceae]MBU9721983.1 DUF348 domain-containing protein [Bacillus alkalicola]